MDDLLHRIERPSRYLGNEINAVKKDLAQVSLRIALAYRTGAMRYGFFVAYKPG